MDTLDYIKYIIRTKREKARLTTFERKLCDIYHDYMYTILIEDNTFDLEKITSILDNFVRTKKIILLSFSGGIKRYIEQDLLCQCDYFNNMIHDVVGNTILLHGILDNERYMDIFLYHLKFKEIYHHNIYNNEEKYEKYDICVFLQVLELFDYVCYSLTSLFYFFENSYLSIINTTFETLDSIAYYMNKNNKTSNVFLHFFRDNEEKYINTYGIDKIFTSNFFKVGVLPYKFSGEIVIKYNFYPYFDIICDNYNYHSLLGKLFKNKPDNWWFIVDKIYNNNRDKQRKYIDIYIDNNKDNLDITFFDTDTTKYDEKLVLYLRNKFNIHQ